jgi:hypothetical protein
MHRALRAATTTGLLAAAAFGAAPAPAALREFAAWLVRPAVLPFAWRGLGEAIERGDGEEAFARAQRILHLLPGWTDGHFVFAYRFALDAGIDDGEAALRLQVALGWLDAARASAGRRELELLQALAFLPEIACRQRPALAARLAQDLGLPGGAEALADRWLAEAERRFPSAAVREQRTFHTPALAGALLTAGDRTAAIAALETAIARADEVRDRELAAEWRERLAETVRWLRGDRAVDLTAVRADRRLEPLWPHLR